MKVMVTIHHQFIKIATDLGVNQIGCSLGRSVLTYIIWLYNLIIRQWDEIDLIGCYNQKRGVSSTCAPLAVSISDLGAWSTARSKRAAYHGIDHDYGVRARALVRALVRVRARVR